MRSRGGPITRSIFSNSLFIGFLVFLFISSILYGIIYGKIYYH